MIVRNENSVRSIRDSLRRLGEFFEKDDPGVVDRETLGGIERELIKMESTLRLFSRYRGRDGQAS